MRALIWRGAFGILVTLSAKLNVLTTIFQEFYLFHRAIASQNQIAVGKPTKLLNDLKMLDSVTDG